MRNDCLIHCTKDSGDLSSVQDLQSWQTLVRAAEIRHYAPILDLAKTVVGVVGVVGEEYACAESAAYEKLFDYVRNNVLVTPNLIRLTDLTQTMISYMKDLGIKETKESSKTHLRRKLEAEFGSLLQFEDLLGKNRVFIIPANLSRLQLAKEVARLQQLQCEGQASLMDDIRRVALEVRKAICCKENEMSWPPKPSQLTEEEINLPDEVRVFLATLLTGNSKYPEEPCSSSGLSTRLGRTWYLE